MAPKLSSIEFKNMLTANYKSAIQLFTKLPEVNRGKLEENITSAFFEEMLKEDTKLAVDLFITCTEGKQKELEGSVVNMDFDPTARSGAESSDTKHKHETDISRLLSSLKYTKPDDIGIDIEYKNTFLTFASKEQVDTVRVRRSHSAPPKMTCAIG